MVVAGNHDRLIIGAHRFFSPRPEPLIWPHILVSGLIFLRCSLRGNRRGAGLHQDGGGVATSESPGLAGDLVLPPAHAAALTAVPSMDQAAEQNHHRP